MRTAALAVLVSALCLGISACGNRDKTSAEQAQARRAMAEHMALTYQLGDHRLMEALRQTPRHVFVPEALHASACTGEAITVSNQEVLAPLGLVITVVRAMHLQPAHTVLMVEPSDCYMVALVARLCRRVTVTTMDASRAKEIEERLDAAGVGNVDVHACNTGQGWSAGAPYRTVVLSTEVTQVPTPLLEQTAKQGLVVVYGGPYATQVRVSRLVEDDLSAPTVVQVPG